MGLQIDAIVPNALCTSRVLNAASGRIHQQNKLALCHHAAPSYPYLSRDRALKSPRSETKRVSTINRLRRRERAVEQPVSGRYDFD